MEEENQKYKELIKMKRTYVILKMLSDICAAGVIGITIDNSLNLIKLMLSSNDMIKNDLYSKYLFIYSIPIVLALFYDINTSFINSMTQDLEEATLKLK